MFNAVLWILRNGAHWRDLPDRYGHWNSIYHKFRQWCKLGIFEKILQIINQEAEESALIEIDSTFCKCSTLKNQSIGSSRGGKILSRQQKIFDKISRCRYNYFILSIVATGLLSFTGVVIETAMNVTFQTLMKEFGVSLATVQWLTTGYLSKRAKIHL